MSLRMPNGLSTSPRLETGLSVLEAELGQERAAALGRLGRDVENALLNLGTACANTPERNALLRTAADATWNFFVQREVCGMMNHEQAIAHYGIPPEVLSKVGAR